MHLPNATSSRGAAHTRAFPGRMVSALLCGSLIWLGAPVAGRTHDSPEHQVTALTERMAREGRSADLLMQRAAEFRALGLPEMAILDLQQAARLAPDALEAQVELSRIYLAQGKLAAALASINQALARAPADADKSVLHMQRALVRQVSGDLERALADCQAAFGKAPANPEWYLTRGQIQTRLGQFRDAAAGLKEGFERTGSFVLEEEWIESLIDGGKYREALEQIEPQLAESRWRSSWLLRRARARIGLDQVKEARADLHTAIAEINRRLSPAQPDLTLLADRAQAYALLGNDEAARKDIATAKAHGADAWVLARARLGKSGRDSSSKGP